MTDEYIDDIAIQLWNYDDETLEKVINQIMKDTKKACKKSCNEGFVDQDQFAGDYESLIEKAEL